MTDCCAYCKRAFTLKNFPTVDHVVPKEKGGGEHSENKIMACYECNQWKANMMPNEWLNHIKFEISKWPQKYNHYGLQNLYNILNSIKTLNLDIHKCIGASYEDKRKQKDHSQRLRHLGKFRKYL